MLKQAGNATVVAPSASWSARRGAGSDQHHLRGEPTDRHFHLGHFDAVGPWGSTSSPGCPTSQSGRRPFHSGGVTSGVPADKRLMRYGPIVRIQAWMRPQVSRRIPGLG